MNPIRALANAAARRLDAIFPGHFATAKHNHYADFGYPEHLTFDMLYGMYQRNGIAAAGVDKTILKTWQDNPFLQEKQRDGSEGTKSDETKLEADIRQRFEDLRIWSRISETDRRSLVGAYSGLILRLADSKKFSEPVDTVPGGLMGLVEVIPAWEGQLQVSQWDTDEMSETYGQPKMYQFNEANVGDETRQPRQFMLHPDRVIVWSRDGTLDCRSLLEPGYNDLITLEKVSGAGGEGFWKNAKSAPVLEVDAEAKLDEMAKIMGVPVDELVDRMNDQVEDWQRGFDKLLMMQGMTAKTLGVTLPSPEHFFAIALQAFAASISIPVKILVGSQTGERASTEDADEWAKTNMSRRTNTVRPNIMDFVNRLERFRILPEKDWYLDWADLTETSMAEKIDRVAKMADTNQKMSASNELVFTADEMREVVGKEPLTDAQRYHEDDDDDLTAAAGLPDDPVTEE
ncbi:anti-CBASS protein Acb1 family protein [Brucella tritici]|uniref:anti-CBASS protein Acb1 family protein n=1 Tax=Brucella tritici TaxID=94626 RepID=UPI002001AC17|nr:anti-CBASS Acb1 family protein [Brucella tritici]